MFGWLLGFMWQAPKLAQLTVTAARVSTFSRYSPNSTWLVLSRHDTTRHFRRVEHMYLACVELVEQQRLDKLDTTSATHSTRLTLQVRLARHVRHDERDSNDNVQVIHLFIRVYIYLIYFILWNKYNLCK